MTQSELRSNMDVVLYALFQLGGHERKVHTEEIAFRAYELAKERFSWRLEQFRQFPDKDPARHALEDAARPKSELVRGRSGTAMSGKGADGWMFTIAGVAWIKENQARIERALGNVRSETRPKEAERFVRRIRGEALFKKFIKGDTLTKDDWYDFTSMLSASPDAPKEMIVRKFQNLQTTAEMVADQDVTRFFATCREAFPQAARNQIGAGKQEESQ